MSNLEEAAAWHGLAQNLAFPAEERLACALEALKVYEERPRGSRLLHPLDTGVPVLAQAEERLACALEALKVYEERISMSYTAGQAWAIDTLRSAAQESQKENPYTPTMWAVYSASADYLNSKLEESQAT